MGSFWPGKMLTLLAPVHFMAVGLSQALAVEAPTEPVQPVSSASVDNQASDDSTVVYPNSFFASYNPVTASDMLDRIPGLSLGGGGGGGRGLGTGGNLLIDGQRLAGKDNSPRDQLERIPAGEVERIEIIRGTSGDLDVRGADQVINVVLTEGANRSSTTVELVARRNHDGQHEAGGNVSYSLQSSGFQGMINLESRPNYENRIRQETSFSGSEEVLGTLRESNIRDQQPLEASSTMSYVTGPHRIQFNVLYEDAGYPRPITREFVDLVDGIGVPRLEEEIIDNDESTWEAGGEYEYDFGGGRLFQWLMLVSDETEDSVRDRYDVNDPGGERDKTLFIDSNENTREEIMQGNYNFPLTDSQSMRVGLERAVTRLDSSLFIGTEDGTEPPSDRFGGLPARPDLSNPGTTVEEVRYEGFAFHNWTLSDRMRLESTLLYETSEIEQSGQVNNSRRFNFLRPSVDFRFDITSSFQLRATVERNVSQLSFANFAATANTDDRDRDADAGNPGLEPEKETRYEVGVEYRLPNDNGVLESRVFFRDIEDYIGRIDATVDPAQPLSAVGNVGRGQSWGIFNSASTRLSYFGLPDAIVTAEVDLFDSQITDPFLGRDIRFNNRGSAELRFRHDITGLQLSYGIDYRKPFDGGIYETDIATITRTDRQPALDLFVSKVLFDDITFRLESNNTLDDTRCRERKRFEPNTISGSLEEIERSCDSRFRRWILRVQKTF